MLTNTVKIQYYSLECYTNTVILCAKHTEILMSGGGGKSVGGMQKFCDGEEQALMCEN